VDLTGEAEWNRSRPELELDVPSGVGLHCGQDQGSGWTETGVVTSGRYRFNMAELDHRSVWRKTGVSPEVEMNVVTRVELECSYWTGDGWTRSRVASMPKESSGGPGLDQSCNWEKYGYDS